MFRWSLLRWCLAAALTLAAANAGSAGPDWVSQMPAPGAVYDKIQGSDDFDTAARRHAAFEQLDKLRRELIGSRLVSNQSTAQERELGKQYGNEIVAIEKALIESLPPAERTGAKSRRAAWFKLTRQYETDAQARQAVMNTFFSADAQRQLVQVAQQAKQAPPSGARAPAQPLPQPQPQFNPSADQRQAGSAIGAWVWWLVGGAVIVVVIVLRSPPTRKQSEKKLEAEAAAATKAWLKTLGASHVERAPRIEALFHDRTATLSAAHFARTAITTSAGKKKEEWATSMFLAVERNLASMNDREREYLRLAVLLSSAADGGNPTYRGWCAALLLGDGKGKVENFSVYGVVDVLDREEAVSKAATALGLKVEPTINKIVQQLASLRTDAHVPEDIRRVAIESVDQLSGRGGWLRPADVTGSVFDPKGPFAIRLGSFADGTPLSYSGSGALMTIAAPGSGKSQCHAIPNLLRWKGAAVVLDLKGELFQATSRWRAENVGPVYRFAPTQPDRSHCYNPLAFVDDRPEHIWQESRFLADMMVVPSGSKDSGFWDSKAKEIVAAGIAAICHAMPPEQRSMARLMDIIHGGQAFEAMVAALQAAVDVPAMMRAGTSLAEMNEKTRADVLATVQTSFHGWGDAPVERTTARSDWSPLDLRRQADRPPTLYICLTPREVESYLSIMRVVLAQHIRLLTAEAPADGDRSKVQPVLFLLDELPRLREMPPVAEAIEIGASFGLRVWMFAQSLGQMQNAYKNADGMIGSCAVRLYMNPSGADGLAEKLSEEIGYTVSLQDGSRKRLVEAAELAGPSYKDLQLAFGQGARPAKLSKDFAWQDQELSSRMGAAEVIPRA